MGVDELLVGLVPDLGLVGVVVEALGLEDLVDLGAVVGDVVDDLDGVAADTAPGLAAVVRIRVTGLAGHADGGVEVETRVELPAVVAVGPVAGELLQSGAHRLGRRAAAAAAGDVAACRRPAGHVAACRRPAGAVHRAAGQVPAAGVDGPAGAAGAAVG